MGNKLIYYLFVKPFSWLPFFILYGLSDVLSFLLFSVFKYRRKVVSENIKNSFPEKSTTEIRRIERKFYTHFSDLIVESIKMFSISESQIKKRMAASNTEVFDKFYKEGRDVILASGHFGNWEMWASGGDFHSPHQVKGVYKPLKNKFWDETAKKSRGKFGMDLVPVKETNNQFDLGKGPVAVALLIDQSPARTKKCYWTTFLNQDTPVNFGLESLAKKHNAPVIYGNIQKVKRGHFIVQWSLLVENPNDTAYGFITEKATKFLEEKIKAYPHLWLWTHKRWKRKLKDDEEVLNVIEPLR